MLEAEVALPERGATGTREDPGRKDPGREGTVEGGAILEEGATLEEAT